MKSSKKSFTNLSAGLLALTSDSVSSEAIVVCNGRCAYCMHNKLSPAQTLAAKKLTCYWKRKALSHLFISFAGTAVQVMHLYKEAEKI